MPRFTTNYPLPSFRTFGIMVMAVALLAVLPACKGKKKATETPNPTETAASMAASAQIAKIKAELEAMLVDKVTPLDDKENRLNEIKALNIPDAEVQVLIRKVEYAIQQERERLLALSKQEQASKEAFSAQNQLNGLFQSVAAAGNTADAQAAINQALSLFSSAEAPVLIVIHQANGQKDYDRPTTIRKYLEYLKDTHQNINDIDRVATDANGKITELELIKRK